MPFRPLAAAFGAALVIVAPARAGDAAAVPCAGNGAASSTTSICAQAPREFRPESQVRGIVENFLRYRVDRVAVDGGCYVVLGTDRNGTSYAVRFRGSDLKMVSRQAVKDTAPVALSFAP